PGSTKTCLTPWSFSPPAPGIRPRSPQASPRLENSKKTCIPAGSGGSSGSDSLPTRPPRSPLCIRRTSCDGGELCLGFPLVTPRLAAWHVALVFTVAVSAFARVPLQTAIDYVADFRNAPQWQPGLAAVDIEAPFPQATHVVEVRRFLGRRIEAPGDLVDWVPGRGFTVRGHSGPLRVESRYSFAREADGTRISLSLTMAARGLARIGEPVLRRSLTRELSLAFERLSPTLDGHVQDA